MPDIFIKDYNTTVNFPDDTSPDIIKQALSKKFPALGTSSTPISPEAGQSLDNKFLNEAAGKLSKPDTSFYQKAKDVAAQSLMAGESLAKEYAPGLYSTLKGTRELAIPTGLAMAGGAAGLVAGPAAPYAVPVLSGAGAALGERINEIIRGESKPLKESFIDAARQTAMGTALTGAADYVGNIAGSWLAKRAAQKEIADKSKNILLQQSKELGVQPTPADITESDILAKGENVLRGLYGSGGVLKKVDEGNTQKLIEQYTNALSRNIPEEQAVDISQLGNLIKKDVDALVAKVGIKKGEFLNTARNKVLKNLGSPLTYEEIGKQAVDVETKRSQSMRKWTNRLYEETKKSIYGKIPQTKQNINLSDVRNEAKGLLTQIDTPNLAKDYADEIKYLKNLVYNTPENAARQFLESNKTLTKNYPELLAFETVDDLISKIKNNSQLMSKYPKIINTIEKTIQPYKVDWDELELMRRASRDKLVKANEALASKTPGMAGQIKQGEGIAALVYGRIKTALQHTQTQFTESLGGDIQRKFEAAKSSSGRMKAIFNDKLFKTLSRDHPGELIDNVLKGYAEVDAVKKALGNKGYDEIVKRGITNKLMGVGVGEIYDPKHTKQMLKNLGDQFLSKTYTREELKQLHTIAKDGIDYANQKLSSNILKSIADLTQSEGYSVASKAFHGRGEHFAGNLKKLFTVASPETREMMKRQLTIELFTGGQPVTAIKKSSIGEITPELIGFSGNKFSKNLARISPVLKTFGYNEDDILLLKKIANVSTSLGGVERMAINPSRTARTWAGWSQGKAATLAGGTAIVQLVSGNIPGAALTALGGASIIGTPYIIARAYSSPMGRKLLTEGFKIPAGTPAATAWMSKVIGYSMIGEMDIPAQNTTSPTGLPTEPQNITDTTYKSAIDELQNRAKKGNNRIRKFFEEQGLGWGV